MSWKDPGDLKPLKRKKEKERPRKRKIKSSLLILDLKEGKLYDSGKAKEGKTFQRLQVLGMNDDL